MTRTELLQKLTNADQVFIDIRHFGKGGDSKEGDDEISLMKAQSIVTDLGWKIVDVCRDGGSFLAKAPVDVNKE